MKYLQNLQFLQILEVALKYYADVVALKVSATKKSLKYIMSIAYETKHHAFFMEAETRCHPTIVE